MRLDLSFLLRIVTSLIARCQIGDLRSNDQRFVKDFAKKARPLYDLFTKDKNKSQTTFAKGSASPIRQWTIVEKNAFQSIKHALTEATLLAFLDPTYLTRLVADASDIALGATLEQQQPDGHWRPIAFFSKSLTTTERRYSTFDSELLAVKRAVRKFKHLLNGIPPALLHVLTDHKAITFAFYRGPVDRKSDRVARTLIEISEVVTDIRHVISEDNIVADALSRNPPSHPQDIASIALCPAVG